MNFLCLLSNYYYFLLKTLYLDSETHTKLLLEISIWKYVWNYNFDWSCGIFLTLLYVFLTSVIYILLSSFRFVIGSKRNTPNELPPPKSLLFLNIVISHQGSISSFFFILSSYFGFLFSDYSISLHSFLLYDYEYLLVYLFTEIPSFRWSNQKTQYEAHTYCRFSSFCHTFWFYRSK